MDLGFGFPAVRVPIEADEWRMEWKQWNQQYGLIPVILNKQS